MSNAFHISFLDDFMCCIDLKGFNGADLRNVCTEAGMFAIRAERDYVIHEDFMKVKCLHPITLSRSLCYCDEYYVPLGAFRGVYGVT